MRDSNYIPPTEYENAFERAYDLDALRAEADDEDLIIYFTCSACKGTGMDRWEENDCATCYGEGDLPAGG